MTMLAATNEDAGPVLHEIVLDDGVLGFPGIRRFALVKWGDDPDTMFSVLRALDGELELVVVPPAVFFPDYVPEIDDQVAASIELADPDDALVLSIITVGDRPEACTANLLGPIIVNLRTRRGVQAVLSPERYATRQPLVGR